MTLKLEEWRSITWSDGYCVSSLGRVRHLGRTVIKSNGRTCHYRPRVLKATPSPEGYPKIFIRLSGGGKVLRYVHSLVLDAFRGPRPLGMEVAHGDNDRSNCRLDNLRYATPKENQADKIIHGTHMFGERHPSATLSESSVLKIKLDLRLGRLQKEIAAQYGVARTTIGSISTGKSWSYLDKPDPHPSADLLLSAAMNQMWHMSHRADPTARALADRHYNRQSIGAVNFAPTGSAMVLVSDDLRAFWITSAPFAQYVKHAWAGAWICSAFRNEGDGIASEMIRAAIAATLAHYGPAPALGMVTFIDPDCVKPIKVRGVETWGWTWRKAGFREVGRTKIRKLLAFQILPADMPEPMAANQRHHIDLPLFHQESHGPDC